MNLRNILWGKKGLTYAGRIYQMLAAYRFMAFVVAVVLQLVLPPPESLTSQTYLLFALAGLYTILKTFLPASPWERKLWLHLLLAGDLAVCLSLVLTSGGLLSGFLLYSLCPLMTAVFFVELWEATLYSLPIPFSLALVHSVFGREGFAPILTQNLLTGLILYSIVSFVLPALAYLTNINIYRYIESRATVEERRRIARELHDTVAQKLGYLNLKLKTLRSSPALDEQIAPQLEEAEEILKETYDDVRESIDVLGLELSEDLRRLFADYIADFQCRAKVQVEFTSPSSPPRLPAQARLQLLRILQEALNNVQKHAKASHVWVELKAGRNLELSIKDDGQGFDCSDLKGYHGLSIMKERAESLGAHLELNSAPGKGTEVKLILPL